MDSFQAICTIFVTVVAYTELCGADREYMVSKAESRAVSVGFETKLECVMNIQPDNFQWKFYPSDKKDAYNPKTHISLTTSPFRFVPPSKYVNTFSKKTSSLTLQVNSEEIAGDYQCLAHYGASVVASVPWRLTIAKFMTEFPRQQKASVTVVNGNTINWRCDPPAGANPEVYVDYFKNDEYFKPVIPVATKSLIIPNVTTSYSGIYTCKVGNIERAAKSDVTLSLNVVRRTPPEPPRFIIKPKSAYNVTQGDSVLLECSAVGNPIPEIEWRKKDGIIPEHRTEMIRGGLIINNVSASDDGVYECIQKNYKGTISHPIVLHYNEAPTVNCSLDSTEVAQGDDLDLECAVAGTPTPEISWFLNGFVVTNDTKIEANDNKIYFKPAEKRHAGNLQIFARNIIGTVYRSIFIKVIPLSTTQENATDYQIPPPSRPNHNKNKSHKSNKHGKMVPPSKPSVSRINDETVLLRWTVQPKGLPIQFYKVQYRELGPANQHDPNSRKGPKWETTNADIAPHIRSYEVTNLKPDHYYKFRIAAVYSNNDNKNSPNSEKFLLTKEDFDRKNPLPVPIITYAESVNSTSVKIYWKLDPSPNITVEGFFVNYISASSAADYMKATIDGQHTTSYVLSHLQPDTVYDIKLQSFTSKSASNFSHIKKVRTLGVITTTTVSSTTVIASSNVESAGISKLYIIIAAGLLGGCGIIFAAVVLLLFCRKSKQKKNSTRGDRDKTDDRHIPADANEYVVGPKGASRSNGCVPTNRITITANPLADADNKNQNMIEMSCLSSQNNNCSSVQASVSGEEGSPTNPRDKINKNRQKRIRNKHSVDSNASGENYV